MFHYLQKGRPLLYGGDDDDVSGGGLLFLILSVSAGSEVSGSCFMVKDSTRGLMMYRDIIRLGLGIGFSCLRLALVCFVRLGYVLLWSVIYSSVRK